MKTKNIFLYLPLLLALMLGTMGCSSDEDTEDVTDERNAISDFFKSVFDSSEKKSNLFDFKNNLSNEENPCILINCEEEFDEVYLGDLPLPTIDFSEFSLLIGKITVPSGTLIDNMSIRQIDNNEVVLAIQCIVDIKGAYTADMCDKYYWKLFPKFHASGIKVEISIEKGEIDEKKHYL